MKKYFVQLFKKGMKMASFTTLPIFNAIKESGQPQDGKLRNIIYYSTDLLFIWDDTKSRLLVQHSKYDGPFQEITPTNIPHFEITFLLVNDILTKAVLWGTNGVLIIDLPQRWGPKCMFENEKKQILARSFILPNIGANILRVRLHPGCSINSHILVLGSDNILYLYNINPVKLVNSYVLGKKSRYLVTLGDTAVDFNFVPGVSENDLPILILKGNGDVCWLPLRLDSSDCTVEGPLPMTPSADDNYGADACSILVISSFPPSVIIATSAGVLYHSLLLPEDVSYKKFRLHVLESVTLDLGLQLFSEDHSPMAMFLEEDVACRRRYFAITASGVHAISLQILLDIEEIIEKPLSTIRRKSTAEFLVCTAADNKIDNCLVGFTSFPSKILVALSNGDVLERRLREVIEEKESPLVKALEEGPITAILKRSGFEEAVDEVLLRAKSIPILKIAQPDMNPQQCLLVLLNYTKSVRDNYFQAFQEARDILNKRGILLRGLLEVHLAKIVSLEMEKIGLQEKAEEIGERVEAAQDNVEILTKRVEKLMLLANRRGDVETTAESEFKRDIAHIEARLKDYRSSVDKIKKSQAYQSMRIGNSKDEDELHLGTQHFKTIMSSLKEMSVSISNLIKEINVIRKNNLLDVE